MERIDYKNGDEESTRRSYDLFLHRSSQWVRGCIRFYEIF